MLSRGFLKKVSEFISYKNLLKGNDKLLVALSGGADSVCLLLTLIDLGYKVEAAHCNFLLRGNESIRDEEFSKKLCKKLNVEIHIAHFDTRSFAKQRKISIEMAARELRYSYFENLRKDIGIDKICIAHHKDDSVETLLMNLIRGTGIQGLSGIRAKNGYIVRPLLIVSHKEILQELESINQDYVIDSSNLIDDVTRNKIRLNIIPLLKQINPSVGDSIYKTSERLAKVLDVYNSIIESKIKDVLETNGDVYKIKLDYLKSSDLREDLLFYIMKKFSFSSYEIYQAEKMIYSPTGKFLQSSIHRLLVDRKYMIIEKIKEENFKEITIPNVGLYVLSDDIKLRVEIIDWDSSQEIEKKSNYLFADKEKVSFPLKIRTIKKGERFIPFGMRGSKLISDYLTDRKVNLFDKRRQLVVEDNSGDILWLVNKTIDNRFKVTKKTKEVLKITLLK